MNKIYIFLIILAIVGCSSSKNISTSVSKEILKNNHQYKYPNIELESKINYSDDNINQILDSKIKLISNDSIGVNILGPFGVNLAKAFGNDSLLNVFSLFENKIYLIEFKKSALLGTFIKFEDIISIFRGINSDYISSCIEKEDKSLKTGETLYLKKFDNYIDFYKLDDNKNLLQWQRKDLGNNTIANISYENFQKFQKFNIPETIFLTIPLNNTSLKFTISDVKELNSSENKVSFNKPSSAEIIKIQ